jgi:outer membrane protein assembly factor BamE (lipoprotein component of BamABCDE complex)
LGIASVPDSSPLAKITIGMADTDVRKILGEPTTQRAYMTGKSWIPFYYGPDTSRTDYIYEGIGRVVFSRSRYSGQLKVIDVAHDPN